MSREQFEYLSNVRGFVILGFGIIGTGIGGLIPAVLSGNTSLDTIGSSIIGAVFGFFPGALIGGAISLFVNAGPVDVQGRTESEGRQLVGETCVVCGQRIGSIVDADFCKGCGNPLHHECLSSQSIEGTDGCPRCGA